MLKRTIDQLLGATLSYFNNKQPCYPAPVAHSAQGRFAQKLLNDLMENYSNALRPVEDTDAALNVTLQITLSQIKDMVSNRDYRQPLPGNGEPGNTHNLW